MNPVKAVADLTKAVMFPFTSLFVVGLCGAINWMASPGHWWVQWVAFGMGVALLCVWARALKTVIVAGLLAGLACLAYCWWNRRPPRNPGQDSTANAAR
jgi:UDP-N-acetylmuramyl pentapeptide phosphotransferase/UDP-N-acetylglucosamine-1-phosphate transferase